MNPTNFGILQHIAVKMQPLNDLFSVLMGVYPPMLSSIYEIVRLSVSL